jgi:hypothetical protein
MSKMQHAHRAAQNMIDRYGADALRQVDLRIEELRLHGNDSARDLWIEIRRAVAALMTPPGNGPDN